MGIDYIMNNGQYALYNGMRVYLSEAAGSLAYYTDDFTGYGADNALGGQGNWIDNIYTPTLGLYSYNNAGNIVVLPKGIGDSTIWTSRYNDIFSNDQFSQIGVPVAGYAIGPCVRLTGDSSTNTCGYGYLVNNGESHLLKITNGIPTILGNAGTTSLVNDDILRLEASGNLLICKKNGVVDTTVATNGYYTDASYASGQAGIFMRGNQSVFGDNWQGGDL